MTAADRAQALEALGYTPRQAAFLALVAVHSGYWVRRQWLAFTGAPHGQCTVDFFAALVARGHARALPCGRHTHVYHLTSRPLYAAIDEEHNRHRRLAAPAVITHKLMTLDVVLAHRDRVWYGTEREKVALVTEQYGVDRACLPAKVYRARDGADPAVTRHFVEKFPVAVAPSSPVVTFTYINAWGQTAEGFSTFLRAYAPLFRQLPAVAVLYASGGADWGHTARVAFARTYGSADGGRPARDERQALAAHFRARQQLEAGLVSAWSPGELAQLRADLVRFRGPAYDRWYHDWQREGDVRLPPADPATMPHGPRGMPVFETYHLPFTYPSGSLQAVVGATAQGTASSRGMSPGSSGASSS